jgi:hypothetical protein
MALRGLQGLKNVIIIPLILIIIVMLIVIIITIVMMIIMMMILIILIVEVTRVGVFVQVAIWDFEKVHERTVYNLNRALTNNLRFVPGSDSDCISASSDGKLRV